MVEITNREVKTKKKSKNKQLNANAICAFRFLKDTKTYLDRIQTLEKCGEYCYAILNIWNRIEATLKLLRYFDDIKLLTTKVSSTPVVGFFLWWKNTKNLLLYTFEKISTNRKNMSTGVDKVSILLLCYDRQEV